MMYPYFDVPEEWTLGVVTILVLMSIFDENMRQILLMFGCLFVVIFIIPLAIGWVVIRLWELLNNR